MKPLAIIGIDPGATLSYTIIGLDGRLIKAHSAKGLSLSDAITQIVDACQPVVIATDKAKTPSLVTGLSRRLGAVVFSPEEDFKKAGKRKMLHREFEAKLFNKSRRSKHEVDSFASAFLAYKSYHPLIIKINNFLAEHQGHQSAFSPHEQREFVRLAFREEMNFLSLKREVLGRQG